MEIETIFKKHNLTLKYFLSCPSTYTFLSGGKKMLYKIPRSHLYNICLDLLKERVLNDSLYHYVNKWIVSKEKHISSKRHMYIITSPSLEKDDMYKIGCTYNCNTLLKELQKHYTIKLYLFYSIFSNNTKECNKEIQKTYLNNHTTKNWYKIYDIRCIITLMEEFI